MTTGPTNDMTGLTNDMTGPTNNITYPTGSSPESHTTKTDSTKDMTPDSLAEGPRLQDQLARESDVTVSTNVTSYTEYRGFFMYVLCTLALAMFVVWILAPHSMLNHVGISYYPDKYWAQAIPAYSLMLMLYAYVSLSLYNIEIRTLDLTDLRTFTDEYAVYPDVPVDYVWKAPSGVWDLPIGLVNEVLYT